MPVEDLIEYESWARITLRESPWMSETMLRAMYNLFTANAVLLDSKIPSYIEDYCTLDGYAKYMDVPPLERQQIGIELVKKLDAPREEKIELMMMLCRPLIPIIAEQLGRRNADFDTIELLVRSRVETIF